MNWYLAKIVFKIVNNEVISDAQFDEQLCLIEARNKQEAFIKARMLGVKNEDEVSGENNRKVFWKFIDVPYLSQVNEFTDGMELYSCIHESDAGDGYEKYIKLKALQLQNSFERNLVSN
ncbi:MAG: DUF4288 domain-containing protein [Bacteroidia bacterium]|nr:DUF4288 domain-containing protein [Bacteroidia bacterium]